MAYNVLIVDDSQTMRKVILKALTISGFDLGDYFEAGNGEEALTALNSQWIDLILTDLNMPVMNGLELIQKIKENPAFHGIPVVLITTEGSEKRLQELFDLGVKEYIQKPFHPETLRDVLTRIMEKPHV
jgi:two-component system, chemotaxis family, chemotaxis protein CheY